MLCTRQCNDMMAWPLVLTGGALAGTHSRPYIKLRTLRQPAQQVWLERTVQVGGMQPCRRCSDKGLFSLFAQLQPPRHGYVTMSVPKVLSRHQPLPARPGPSGNNNLFRWVVHFLLNA